MQKVELSWWCSFCSEWHA